jgi:mono/diheme cytochrome c family protein
MRYRYFCSGFAKTMCSFAGLLLTCLAPINLIASPADGVYDTPEAAAADKDFAIQGEYTAPKLGMQVIALGEGDFNIVLYQGGLPGAGWDKTPPQRTDGDAATVEGIVESRGMSRIERKSPTLGAKPPAAAIVLFDGTQSSLEKHWVPGSKRTEDGWLMQGTSSTDTFRDYVLHIEFRTPFQPKARGQGRGNSGVYHQGRYETQVLDSFGLDGKDNETGGIYSIRAPDLNMCLPPLTWQTYDVEFTAARFDADGKKTSDAKLTVRLNGEVVQRDTKLPHITTAAPNKESAEPGPLYLQDHGNPVRYRNIWIVPRDADKDARRPRIPAFERFYAAQSNAPESAHIGGRVLIAQLGCTACHAAEHAQLVNRSAPLLGQVGGRLRPDHLLKFISAPHATKAGTAMPDVFHAVSGDKKARQTEAIASYLLSTGRLIDRSGDSAAAKRGEDSFHTVGCAACHAPRRGAADWDATSFPLGDLTAKYTLDSLSRFLTNPHAIRPSGLMPKLVNDLSEARDIACYLLGDKIIVPGAEQFQAKVYFGSWDKLPDFDQLQPAKTGTTNGLDLTLAGRDSDFAMVFEAYLPIASAGEYQFFLSSDDGSRLKIDGKQVVEYDGIHPADQRRGKVKLDAGIHPLRIEYFEKGGEEVLSLDVAGPDFGRTPIASLITSDSKQALETEVIPSVFKAKPELVAAGKELFQSVGCANCHKLQLSDEVVGAKKAKPLNQLKLDAGCLADQTPADVPKYELNSVQRESIAAAIKGFSKQLSASEQLELHLASSNCLACHNRGELGGPEATRDPLFLTRMQEMGNEGRLPPPLIGVGDKLQPKYLAATIANGGKERPYMLTRMPGFGEKLGESIRDLLVALDTQPAARDPKILEVATHNDSMISSGRKLVGGEGLACIKCHTFGKKATPGIQAIDMLRMTERLNADWFHRYMLEPTKYRPGTRMPLSFPEGKSTLTTVLDGDAHQQIDAMWAYLAQGEKAREPVGLDAQAIVLKPTDRPVIYRNFIEGLSPRGIAVGYPEQVNIAWDAGNMSLSLIWKNEFIDASKHWVGRGPGNQTPLGDDVIKLESSAPIAVLESVDAAWPTKLARQRDYRFQGYSLNSAGQPSFRYQFADVSVEDYAQPKPAKQNTVGLTRRLSIKLEKPTKGLVFRAASGKIVAVDGGYLIDDQVRIAIEGTTIKLIDVAGKQELRAELPETGQFTIIEELQW